MEAGIHVALLRGVNVGGNNRLPMKGLVAMFVRAGCTGVQTYIQSGNVVFNLPAAGAKNLSARIERELEACCGNKIPLVFRSALELRNVAKKNPFLAAGADPERVHVAFLADKPSAKAVAALDHDRSPPDEFTLIGREIYLHTPKGLGQSKLTNAYFDRALETTSTVRNWRTLLALCELCDAAKS